MSDQTLTTPRTSNKPIVRRIWDLLARHAAILISAGLGLAWFVHWAGWKVLDPTHVSWVLTGEDWHQHVLGWWFFRNEPWGLPLGEVNGLVHPLGTNIGFTDTTPWVAIALKVIAPLLPVEFQFVGPWLGLCFALLGATGAWVARRNGAGAFAQIGAGLLLACTPVMMERVGHESLCAHFLLVLAIALHFEPAQPESPRRRLVAAWVLTFIAGGIHPYLAAMVMAICAALPLTLMLSRNDAAGRLRPQFAALATLTIAVTPLAVFALIGYFGQGATTDAGFGYFNADVLALVNPHGKSRFVPNLPLSRPHYEGYGFLGLGGFWIVLAALIAALIRFRAIPTVTSRRAIPLLVVVTGATLYAFATRIELGQRTLLDLSAVYAKLGWLTGTFRGSGRFIWIAHYSIIVTAFFLVCRLLRERRAILAGVLLIAGTLQAIDFNYGAEFVFRKQPGPVRTVAPLWSEIGAEYRHLVMLPPQIFFPGAPCGGQFPGDLMYHLATVAYRQKMTFNSGVVARAGEPARRYCSEAVEEFSRGELEASTVYVVSSQVARRIRADGGTHACGRVDGFFVCVNSGRETRIRSMLEQR